MNGAGLGAALGYLTGTLVTPFVLAFVVAWLWSKVRGQPRVNAWMVFGLGTILLVAVLLARAVRTLPD
jgi:hypothetical protein